MPWEPHQCLSFVRGNFSKPLRAGEVRFEERTRTPCTKSTAGAKFARAVGFEKFPRGFTLIEILVVIIILGIATVMATANLFQTDEEKLQQESEKLLAVLQIARDEAAFGGKVIAVTINDGQIQFLERDFADPSRWSRSTMAELKSRALTDTFNARLQVGSASADAKDNHITFLPIGVAAPFEFVLRAPAGTRRISGDAIGNLRLSKDPV